MDQAYVEIKGLRHKYNGRTVLAIDDLRLERGEVLTVIGPNGAGKSTLLRLVGLLERPTVGKINLDGKNPWKRSCIAWRRRMATVFQEPLLFKGSVFSNVAYGLRLRGRPKAEVNKRVLETLSKLNVEHLARRSAGNLSGGEAQRVALARALVLDPELLLLDEPLASLDPPSREVLLEDLQALLADTRVTACHVTHNRSEALVLADRVAVLIGGKVAQVGTRAEVFGAPVNQAVANLVGVETVVSGKIVSSDRGLVKVSIDGELVEAVSSSRVGEAVFACIRPEEVMVLEKGLRTPSSARNHLNGLVTKMINLGPYFRVTIDVQFQLVAFVTKKSVDEMKIETGKMVSASFKATAVHVIRRQGFRDAQCEEVAPADEAQTSRVERSDSRGWA